MSIQVDSEGLLCAQTILIIAVIGSVAATYTLRDSVVGENYSICVWTVQVRLTFTIRNIARFDSEGEYL